MSDLTREQIEQSLYELQRELAVAKVDADHFFQLSGQYLERANKAEAEAEALRNSVISDEHLQAVASEVRLLHLVEQTATIDGMSIRACACLGPLPECLCVKRNKLVSEFLAAIDASRKG